MWHLFNDFIFPQASFLSLALSRVHFLPTYQRKSLECGSGNLSIEVDIHEYLKTVLDSFLIYKTEFQKPAQLNSSLL